MWYPLSEILTGLVLAIMFVLTFQDNMIIFILYGTISLCLLTITFSDLKHEIIPFPIVFVATIATLVLLLLGSHTEILTHILAGLGAGLFFLVIFLVTKGRGMGFGDVIYALFMGFLLGFPYILLGLYLSFIIGAVISLVLIVLKKKKLHGGTIPFGPFLVLGTFIMMVWGEQIIQLTASYFK